MSLSMLDQTVVVDYSFVLASLRFNPSLRTRK
jgi:hypothetical protein